MAQLHLAILLPGLFGQRFGMARRQQRVVGALPLFLRLRPDLRW
jgi:hypothetical protein